MKIGEIVETLIRIRDWYTLNETEREALAEACNLLDRLPRLDDSGDVNVWLERITKEVRG